MKGKAWLWIVVLTACIFLGTVCALAESPYGWGEVISQKVSLRENHSTGSKLIRSLNNGETFNILDRYDDWLFVSYTGAQTGEIQGWLSSDYIVENPVHITLRKSNVAAYAYPPSGSKKVGSLDKYTRLTVIEQLEKYWVVNLREAAAFVPKSADVWFDEDLEQWLSAVPTQATVANKTKLRTGPGTNWTTVKTLAAGTPVSILGTEGDWCVIPYDAAVAYILAADVSY